MVDYVKPNSKNVAIKEAYKDLDLNFMAHPITGDVTTKSDSEAVKRAVKNIVLTNYYERPFKPSFGANLRGLLFELADDMTKFEIRKQIIEALEMLEPRVTIDEIYLQSTRNNEMHVNLHYGVVGVREPQTLEVILQRVR